MQHQAFAEKKFKKPKFLGLKIKMRSYFIQKCRKTEAEESNQSSKSATFYYKSCKIQI